MAHDETTPEESLPDPDRRRSPLGKHVPLWIGFLLVLAIGIVTVLLPEVSDEGDEEDADGTPTSASDDDADDGDEPPAAAAATAPSAPAGAASTAP